LGEGGFGIVFLAEQQQPLRRQVALKVIKPGMDSRQVIARFEAERQALALMDHANVAHVLDAGTTEQGRLFFVMELVRGVHVTEFCDQARLSVRDRLELFLSICAGVQHAHTKGIIHRDLKPSNVLVTAQGGPPVVKVIDFGISKALEQPPDRTVLTGQAQMIGTPLYLSPEQAGSSGLDVDTRTDVYALGVLLYELLTGTTPLDRQRLGQAGYDEIRRIIREEEPPKPSTRLSTLGQAATTLSAQRQSDPKRLGQVVRGELDWVVMKCLEKDRERRYETASALAADLERYLGDELVLAGPPSAGYKLRKFVRRNRGPVLAVALVLLALIAGLGAASWGLVCAERARLVAENAQEDAEAAALEERKAKETAKKRLVQIEKANAILASIFHELDPKAEEKGGPALRVQLGERLDQAARLLEGEAIGDALTVARLQNLLGTSLQGLGHYEKALPLLLKSQQTREAALGPDAPYTLSSKNSLALLYHVQGKYEKAEPLLLEVLGAETARLGAHHLRTLNARHNLALLYKDQGKYDQAELLFQEVLRGYTAVLRPHHPCIVTTKSNLAVLYQHQGRYDKAEPLFLEVLRLREKELGADHLYTLGSKYNLAALYQHEEKYDRAGALYEEVVQARTAKLGANHPATLVSKNNLAMVYQAQRRYGQAEPLLQQVLQAQTGKLGAGHPQALATKNNLAVLYWSMRKLDRSVPLFEQTLRSSVKTLGAAHPETITRAFNLGVNYCDAGQLENAVALFEEWLARSSISLKAGHPTRQFGLGAAVETYRRAGRHPKAEPLLRELVAVARQAAGGDSPTCAGYLDQLGRNLLMQRKDAEAEAVLRECLAIRQKRWPDDWGTFDAQSVLGAALLGQEKYAEAEPLLVQGYQRMKQRQTRSPRAGQARLTEALERVVLLYDGWGKKDKADEWRKQLEARRQAQEKASKAKDR
jgi:tetratricopeptide (TPR) repeat protein